MRHKPKSTDLNAHDLFMEYMSIRQGTHPALHGMPDKLAEADYFMASVRRDFPAAEREAIADEVAASLADFAELAGVHEDTARTFICRLRDMTLTRPTK